MKYTQTITWDIQDVDPDVARLAEVTNSKIEIGKVYEDGHERLRMYTEVLDGNDQDIEDELREAGQIEAADLIRKIADGHIFDHYDGQYNFEGLTEDEDTANEVVDAYIEAQRKLYPNTKFVKMRD